MSETAIVARNVEVVQTGMMAGSSPFSWSAAIAGALAATASSFLLQSEEDRDSERRGPRGGRNALQAFVTPAQDHVTVAELER